MMFIIYVKLKKKKVSQPEDGLNEECDRDELFGSIPWIIFGKKIIYFW